MPRAPRTTPLGDVDPFTPDRARPVRVRARAMPVDSHFEPHSHPWAQLAYCSSGIVQVTSVGEQQATYIVPPSRAVWIAPQQRHAVHVLEAAQFQTLYMDPSVTPPGWSGCRVIRVSPLLREMVLALDQGGVAPAREAHLAALVLDEIRRADTQALGVPLPSQEAGDKRLRALCEAVLAEPASRHTLAQWAARVGASERTLARLFRDELGLSWQQWRQQATLAHALPLLARGVPVSHVAGASGYSSESAFTAMFKSAMGQPPGHFLSKNGPQAAPTLPGQLSKR